MVHQSIPGFVMGSGILLDPVYSGKAAAGLLNLILKGKIGRDGERIVFLHTGGSVGLFGYDWAFEREPVHRDAPEMAVHGDVHEKTFLMARTDPGTRGEDTVRAERSGGLHLFHTSRRHVPAQPLRKMDRALAAVFVMRLASIFTDDDCALTGETMVEITSAKGWVAE